MPGAKEVFDALFRLMKAKGLLSDKEYDDLKTSMEFVSIKPFLKTVNKICEDDAK